MIIQSFSLFATTKTNVSSAKCPFSSCPVVCLYLCGCRFINRNHSISHDTKVVWKEQQLKMNNICEMCRFCFCASSPVCVFPCMKMWIICGFTSTMEKFWGNANFLICVLWCLFVCYYYLKISYTEMDFNSGIVVLHSFVSSTMTSYMIIWGLFVPSHEKCRSNKRKEDGKFCEKCIQKQMSVCVTTR